jgi:3-hydroxybutyryl-CoA dehydrogenase
MKFPVIGVVGSGTMGRGIAIAAATSGRQVRLYDVSAEVLTAAMGSIDSILQKGVERGKISEDEKPRIIARFKYSEEMTVLADSDVVIEAAPEHMDLKKKIFQGLIDICRDDTILASNTSALSITAIAATMNKPERIAGMHFFNPANIMKLVEVVQSRFTSEETMQGLCELSEDMGKTPARVKDTPGFIVNRVARSFYSESLKILEERVADIETIDRIVTAHGFKLGPFQLMDLIGIDVNYEVTRAFHETYHGEPRYRPSHIQKALVDAGMLGRKTGRGFYEYNVESKAGKE